MVLYRLAVHQSRIIAPYLLIAVVFTTYFMRRVRKNERAANGGKLVDGRVFYAIIASIVFVFWPVILVVNLFCGLKRKRKQEIEDKKRAQNKLKQEAHNRGRNQERLKKIAEWQKEHPVVLFYHTMAGVTAVVRKDDYELAVEETWLARINGFWQNEHSLQPIYKTFLFIHKSGMSQVPENFRAGWMSDFEDLKRIAILERKDDLFVPFASDGIMPIPKQTKRIFDLKKQMADNNESRLRVSRNELLQQIVPIELTA